MKEKFGRIFVLALLNLAFLTFSVFAQKNQQLIQKKDALSESETMAQAVLDEINAARADPQRFIPFLEDYRKILSGKNGKKIFTFEGTVPVDEAIQFLKNQKPLQPLRKTDGLIKAAALQLNDLSINPGLDHTGADGSSFDERIKRFGTTRSFLGENIAYQRNTVREIVLMWIIDDGISIRLHRKNLFNPDFKQAGVVYGPGKDGRGLCVMVLAAEFTEKGKPTAIEF